MSLITKYWYILLILPLWFVLKPVRRKPYKGSRYNSPYRRISSRFSNPAHRNSRLLRGSRWPEYTGGGEDLYL